jgi:glycogen operon protein
LGATVLPTGINFSVYAPAADAIDLLLFAEPRDPAPQRVITLDPDRNRTRQYWHVFVAGVGHGQVYAWRARGPRDAAAQHFFDADKILLDPYGRGVTGLDVYDRQAARRPGDNCAAGLRSVAVDPARYDWEGDRPLPRPEGREVIYEMHVGAFTADPSSGVPRLLRGTYAGVTRKIEHLTQLGVTAVELLPIQAFDPQDAPAGMTNYWGYSSVGWFAPHPGFSADQTPCGPCDEFRDMVKALHRAGIRVILDVVFNHTAEGEADGPVISWRGLAGADYYIPGDEPGTTADFTGCGNTFNANQPVATAMVLEALRHWVAAMHVDGFRFDLASALTRGGDGRVLDRPPLIEAVIADPHLSQATLIAEAWDAAGLYQVGSFGGRRFAEWNGPFRDDVRRFLRGDDDTVEKLMARLVGSHDIFAASGRLPFASINFVTSHDGFSLRDLVSFDHKHNDANGEDNRDGSDDNLSWNCGHEGPTTDAAVNARRSRQMRNFLCLLFFAHGTPMLRWGDECGQSRQGNNNPWCQDNELNWMDWDPAAAADGLLRFTRQLISLTGRLPQLQDNRYWQATDHETTGDISWHGVRTDRPDWSPGSRALAYTLEAADGADAVHLMLNVSTADLAFELPPPADGADWVQVIDTALPSPEDFRESLETLPPTGASVTVAAHSVAVCLANRNPLSDT